MSLDEHLLLSVKHTCLTCFIVCVLNPYVVLFTLLESCLLLQAPACKAALQCLGQVLSAVEPGSWHAASVGFQLLLSFITDARPKIRKRATSSVTDMLAAAQTCPGNLTAASEAVLTCKCQALC